MMNQVTQCEVSKYSRLRPLEPYCALDLQSPRAGNGVIADRRKHTNAPRDIGVERVQQLGDGRNPDRGERRRIDVELVAAEDCFGPAHALDDVRGQVGSVRLSSQGCAPSAARTASSPSRRTDRARIKFATFEHAMTKISAEAASKTSSTVRAGDTIWSRSVTASMR